LWRGPGYNDSKFYDIEVNAIESEPCMYVTFLEYVEPR